MRPGHEAPEFVKACFHSWNQRVASMRPGHEAPEFALQSDEAINRANQLQ